MNSSDTVPDNSVPTLRAETVETKRFGGRNRAVLLGCIDSKGDAITCVVKLAHRIEKRNTDLFWVEWVAGLLADRLGVPTPRRFIVDVSAPLATILGRVLAEGADDSIGLNFGVEFVRDAFIVPSEERALEAQYRDTAARIAAFDVFVDNPDRRKDNPNCLMHAGNSPGLVAIDHDLAFSGLYLPIFGARWPLDILATHVFTGRFGKNTPELRPIRASIQDLDDAFLEALPTQVPLPWLGPSAATKLTSVIAKLKERRDTVDAWFPAVETWIQRP